MGKMLRIDLTTGTLRDEPPEPETAEKYLDGTGFGIEYLYREVPPGVNWDDPQSRIITVQIGEALALLAKDWRLGVEAPSRSGQAA